MRSTEIAVDTSRAQVVDITDDVEAFVGGGESGLLSILALHATAGLALMETGSGIGARPGRRAASGCCRATTATRTATAAPGHGADHLLPALVSPSLTLPVAGRAARPGHVAAGGARRPQRRQPAAPGPPRPPRRVTAARRMRRCRRGSSSTVTTRRRRPGHERPGWPATSRARCACAAATASWWSTRAGRSTACVLRTRATGPRRRRGRLEPGGDRGAAAADHRRAGAAARADGGLHRPARRGRRRRGAAGDHRARGQPPGRGPRRVTGCTAGRRWRPRRRSSPGRGMIPRVHAPVPLARRARARSTGLDGVIACTFDGDRPLADRRRGRRPARWRCASAPRAASRERDLDTLRRAGAETVHLGARDPAHPLRRGDGVRAAAGARRRPRRAASLGAAAVTDGAPLRVSLTALGCKVNYAEMADLAGRLAAARVRGGPRRPAGRRAGAQLLHGHRRGRRHHAPASAPAATRRPGAHIVLTGCSVDGNPHTYLRARRRRPPHASRTASTRSSPTPRRQASPRHVLDLASRRGAARRRRDGAPPARSRAFIKVQDGCNHRCTYCSVWRARGASRSLPLADDPRPGGACRRRRVTPSWCSPASTSARTGAATAASLAHLVRTLLDDVGARARIRLSSVNTNDITAELIELNAPPAAVLALAHAPAERQRRDPARDAPRLPARPVPARLRRAARHRRRRPSSPPT